MSKFANFVQCSLVAGITAASTTIQVEAQAPYNLPVDPAGQTAYITIMDNLNAPSAFEIVGYTGVTPIDANSLELTGCTRGQRGTTAKAWSAGEFIRQDVMAENLAVLDLQDIQIYAASADTTIRRIQYTGVGAPFMTNHQAEVESIAVASDGTVFSVDADSQVIATAADGTVLATAVRSGFNATIVTPKYVVGVNDSDELVFLNRSDLSVAKTITSGTSFADGITADLHGNVYAGLTDGSPYLVKFNPDGEELWRLTDPSFNGGRPAQLKWVEARQRVVFRDSGSGLYTADILEVDENGVNLTTLVNDADQVGTVIGYPRLRDANEHYIWVDAGNAGHDIYDYSGVKQFDVAIGTAPYAATQVNMIDDTYAVITEAGGTWQIGDPGFTSLLRLVDFTTDTDQWSFEDVFANVNAFAVFNPRGSVIFADGFEFKYGQPDYDSLETLPGSVGQKVFTESLAASTPPAGKCYVYMDEADGAFKVRFSNGVVKTIATP